LNKAKLALTLGTLSVLTTGWAVPLAGAARPFVPTQRRIERTETRIPSASALLPIRFREDRNAGLLVTGWINDIGPFTFAIDTGAGVSIITNRVVSTVRLNVAKARRPLVGGLSTAPIASTEEARANRIAIGTSSNEVPGRPALAVVANLPAGIDGILDPTEIFGSLSFSIDLPNHQLLAFDPKDNGFDLSRPPRDGAIVKWIRSDGDRPFVRLGDGRLALLDTGSSLGLAVNETAVGNGRNHSRQDVGDLGGGSVQTRNVGPTTVSIGALVLRGVPTDMLIGVPADTPTILGRRALYPFKITFVPTARLIVFEPVVKNPAP